MSDEQAVVVNMVVRFDDSQVVEGDYEVAAKSIDRVLDRVAGDGALTEWSGNEVEVDETGFRAVAVETANAQVARIGRDADLVGKLDLDLSDRDQLNVQLAGLGLTPTLDFLEMLSMPGKVELRNHPCSTMNAWAPVDPTQSVDEKATDEASDDPLGAKGVEATLAGLSSFAAELDADWEEGDSIEWQEVEDLARLTQAAMLTDPSISDNAMILLRSIRDYAVEVDEWDSGEVVQWPERIRLAAIASGVGEGSGETEAHCGSVSIKDGPNSITTNLSELVGPGDVDLVDGMESLLLALSCEGVAAPVLARASATAVDAIGAHS